MPVISFNWPNLMSGVSGNYSYQWYLNNTLISGATSNTYLPLANGGYTVLILDSNQCSKLSQPFYLTSIGINELSQLKAVVSPNPFSETTTIFFDKNLNGDYDLLFYNLLGNEVNRLNAITSDTVIINTKDIGKGILIIYLVNNKTGERIFIEKLVAE